MNENEITNISTNSLRKRMYLPDEMDKICELNATLLKTQIDTVKILKTLAKLESTYGQNCIPRFEPAYYPGGLYFRKSKMLRNGYDNWGALISFSYGPFQITWCKAAELGFPIDRSPVDLWNGYVSAVYVAEFLNDANSKGLKTLEEILACYNGGLGAVKYPSDGVKRYVQNGLAIYRGL